MDLLPSANDSIAAGAANQQISMAIKVSRTENSMQALGVEVNRLFR